MTVPEPTAAVLMIAGVILGIGLIRVRAYSYRRGTRSGHSQLLAIVHQKGN
jgi:hypothetical protein